jgi:hypothetical protein
MWPMPRGKDGKNDNVPKWSEGERAARRAVFCAGRPKIPSHVLEDRDRRLGLELTLNQQILGDPCAGRSALDTRSRST